MFLQACCLLLTMWRTAPLTKDAGRHPLQAWTRHSSTFPDLETRRSLNNLTLDNHPKNWHWSRYFGHVIESPDSWSLSCHGGTTAASRSAPEWRHLSGDREISVEMLKMQKEWLALVMLNDLFVTVPTCDAKSMGKCTAPHRLSPTSPPQLRHFQDQSCQSKTARMSTSVSLSCTLSRDLSDERNMSLSMTGLVYGVNDELLTSWKHLRFGLRQKALINDF